MIKKKTLTTSSCVTSWKESTIEKNERENARKNKFVSDTQVKYRPVKEKQVNEHLPNIDSRSSWFIFTGFNTGLTNKEAWK